MALGESHTVTRYRAFSSRLCWLLALAFAGFEFYTVGFGILAPLGQRATMLAFAAVLVFLLYPTANWTTRDDNAMETGFTACRLAITAFIAPFLFIYYPELLLLEGLGVDVGYRLGVCLAGIYFVAMAAMGYGFKGLGWMSRGILAAAAMLLFLEPWWMNGMGLALGIGHVIW